MHYYESECHAKRLVCYFQGQGHCKSLYDQNMTISADPFAAKPGFIVHYHKPKCFMEKLDCSVQGEGHSKISRCNECLSGWYFLNCWTFTTKLGMMMHHYEPDCLSKRLVCCVPGQGHS